MIELDHLGLMSISFQSFINGEKPIETLSDIFTAPNIQVVLYDMESILYLTFDTYQTNHPYSKPTSIEEYFKGYQRYLKRFLINPKDKKNLYLTYVQVAVFGSIKNFRKEIDPTYKAHRNSSPLPHSMRFKKLEQLFKDIGMLVTEAPEGYEADDGIASIACKLGANASSVIIKTTDTDLLQLVNNYTTVKLLKQNRTRIDAQLYSLLNFNYFGLLPESIPEFKALSGEINDNIKGVLTYKEANSLIRQYGTVKQVYENLNKIEVSMGVKLMNKKELILRNLRLTTLVKDLL